MKDMLYTLLRAFGPSGYEDGIRAAIEEAVRPYVDEMRVDALGNLIAIKRGSGRKIMLAAHMDQTGFVVTEADDKGFLRVHNVGWPRRLHALNRPLTFQNGVKGVLSYEVDGHNPSDTTMKSMFVDIGASSREEALGRVAIGDMAVYTCEVNELSGDAIAAPAMDNRAGCALVIEALKALGDTANEIYAVFSVQEEVGLRGAGPAAYDIAPDEALAIDVTPTGDTPKSERQSVRLGGGIAVKIMDGSIICAPDVVRALEEAARQSGAKCQREVLTRGGTDAGAIHLTRGGVKTGALSIPCRYVHSATEVISLSDMQAGVQLLAAYLKA